MNNIKGKTIENCVFDEERALYNLTDAVVKNCVFAGERDGESVLKESHDIVLIGCSFSLRYPLWHTERFELTECTMDASTRAPLWYNREGKLVCCNIQGVKCLRESHRILVDNCDIVSPEFGWKCSDIAVDNSRITAEYLFLETKNITASNITMKGKYSFQYTENVDIRNSVLDTKDAFWHSKNVIVRDSTVKGEYLGWFSDGLTLVNCKISGTQPLCYCKNLTLIDCTMDDTDLSFEYSDVRAKVNGHIISIKNPHSGEIRVDSVGEIIREDAVMECNADIYVNGEKR